jgi:hypothetical protein
LDHQSPMHEKCLTYYQPSCFLCFEIVSEICAVTTFLDPWLIEIMICTQEHVFMLYEVEVMVISTWSEVPNMPVIT